MQVVIHAGAAFADEGQVLSSLSANKQALADCRAAILGPRGGRQFVKVLSDALAQDLSDAETQDGLHALLPDDPNVDRVILSNDKFFGPTRSALQHGQIYPFAGQRTAYVQTLLDDAQVEIFVGLVNPGFFIPKVLMSIHEDHRQEILTSTDLSCLSWLSMIEDLRDLAPQVQLTLWKNEHLPLILGDITRAMAGLPGDAPLVDEYALLSSLLTETGQQHVLDIVRGGVGLDKDAQREDLARVLEDYARPDEVEEELDLPGWNADIVDAFTELYEQDLAIIQTMQGIRML